MRSGAAIQVEGLRELRRDLRRIHDSGLNQSLRDVNRDLAREIVSIALPLVPVKSGRLKTTVRALGNLSGAIGKAGGARAPYAAAIHWGQSRGNTNFRHGRSSRGRHAIAGRPFLWQAGQQVERNVEDTYRRAIDHLLDTIRSR